MPWFPVSLVYGLVVPVLVILVILISKFLFSRFLKFFIYSCIQFCNPEFVQLVSAMVAMA